MPGDSWCIYFLGVFLSEYLQGRPMNHVSFQMCPQELAEIPKCARTTSGASKATLWSFIFSICFLFVEKGMCNIARNGPFVQDAATLPMSQQVAQVPTPAKAGAYINGCMSMQARPIPTQSPNRSSPGGCTSARRGSAGLLRSWWPKVSA